ncbi:hypothetical protein MYP_2989 [Sporocytophaga myxococcoides]|uniref:Uncharacterized protein n=1 Tax=Sporocytophaga myxococcoides TaxID=153721 RepID=A0A098LFM0_9BACT|nr:hypothetical protein [Sporocytophaga myxococcoides]GAL85760.1 hypothetical protein MYP_2989 [Sporocytophaga myxococcoides]
MKARILFFFLTVLIFFRFSETFGQNAILTGMEQSLLLNLESDPKIQIKVTSTTINNVDKVYYGIGTKENSIDIISLTSDITVYEGKVFLKSASGSFEEITGRDLYLPIPFNDIDLIGKFLTVYLVNKDGSFSNKLSIPAK